MGLTVDLSQTYRYWLNREAVTYFSHAAEGDTAYALSDCKRRQLTFKELAGSAGVYVGADRAWLIPAAILPPGLTPKLADRIRDAQGTDWTVIGDAQLNSYQTWYRLVCRDLVLVNELRDLADVYRPQNNQDPAGNRVPDYAGAPAYAQVPCRLQEQEGTREESFGKLGLTRRYTVYLGQRLTVTAEDRLVVGGVNYQVTGYRNPDRIDLLMEIDVERLP